MPDFPNLDHWFPPVATAGAAAGAALRRAPSDGGRPGRARSPASATGARSVPAGAAPGGPGSATSAARRGWPRRRATAGRSGVLLGFRSVDRPDEAVIHLVAVDPAVRRRGIGRRPRRAVRGAARRRGRHDARGDLPPRRPDRPRLLRGARVRAPGRPGELPPLRRSGVRRLGRRRRGPRPPAARDSRPRLRRAARSPGVGAGGSRRRRERGRGAGHPRYAAPISSTIADGVSCSTSSRRKRAGCSAGGTISSQRRRSRSPSK